LVCISLKAFYVRRASADLAAACICTWLRLTLLGAFGWIDISLPQIASSALFFCNLNADCSWFAGHTWSLAYEEQFYLLFPALFVVLGLGPRPRMLLLILGVMVLLSLGCRGLGMDWLAGYLSHMAFLLTGCAAALYWDRLAPLCRSLSFNRWIAALAVLVACVGLLPYPLEAYVQTMLYPPLIGLLVLGTPLAQPRVRAFFQNPLGLIPWQNLLHGLFVATTRDV
jgi:peptidoglycan/LPS O-acetylase OafA/YrhL